MSLKSPQNVGALLRTQSCKLKTIVSPDLPHNLGWYRFLLSRSNTNAESYLFTNCKLFCNQGSQPTLTQISGPPSDRIFMNPATEPDHNHGLKPIAWSYSFFSLRSVVDFACVEGATYLGCELIVAGWIGFCFNAIQELG